MHVLLHQLEQGSLFFTSSPAFLIYVLFDDSHSDKSNVVLICISLMANDVEHLFMCVCWPCAFPLWKIVYSYLLSIFKIRLFEFCCFFFFDVELYELFYICGILTPYQSCHL